MPSFLNIFSGDLYCDALIIEPFRIRPVERVNFKKYFLVCLGRGGKFVNSQAKRLTFWDQERRKLCMVPYYHNCHICGWARKLKRYVLKLSFGDTRQVTKGRTSLYGKKGFSPCNTANVKLYDLISYCKSFYKIALFTILLLFYLFCIHWDMKN